MTIKQIADLSMEYENVQIDTLGENGKTLFKGLPEDIPEHLLDEAVVSWNVVEDGLCLNIEEIIEIDISDMPENYPDTDKEKEPAPSTNGTSPQT